MRDREIRRARKPHRCMHCARTIPAGSQYVYQRLGPWHHPENEYFFDYKAHQRCDEFWMDVGDDTNWLFWDSPVEFRVECWRWHVRARRAQRKMVAA